MDILGQTTVGMLNSILPPPLFSLLQQHILDPSSPVRQTLLHLRTALSPLFAQLYGVLTPLIDRLLASPDAVILVVFLAVIVFVIQLLSYLQRIMLFWTRLALRVLFWSAVAAVVAVVWQRGWEQSVKDAEVLGGWALGFGRMVKEVFGVEYRKYSDLESERRREWKGQGRGW